jgi:hypothetical protein
MDQKTSVQLVMLSHETDMDRTKLLCKKIQGLSHKTVGIDGKGITMR